jgi:hypothetical protein
MDSGRLPMYNLARRPSLFVFAGSVTDRFLDFRYGFFIRPARVRFSCIVNKWLKVRHALGHSGVGIIIII